MSEFLTPYLKKIEPYTPGEQPRDMQYVKLNTNESPYPPSPLVKQAISEEEVDKLRLYSDPELKDLIAILAKYHSISTRSIFCGNGSDEVLAMSFMAWGGRCGVAYPDISYGFYPVYANVFNLDSQVIPLDEAYKLNIADVKLDGKMLVFANPNAPTGLSVSLNEIENVLKNNSDSVVIVDEAYVDFGGVSAVELINKYDNLLVVRTFSKSRQLAGARLGYAIGSEQLIDDLNRVKFSINPYNINRLTCIAGVSSVSDNDYFEMCVDKVINTRAHMTDSLRKLGFDVLESNANFVFAKHSSMSGRDIYSALKEQGILVRHFNKERISDFVRITVGTDEETTVLIDKLKLILGEC